MGAPELYIIQCSPPSGLLPARGQELLYYGALLFIHPATTSFNYRPPSTLPPTRLPSQTKTRFPVAPSEPGNSPG